MCKTIQVGSKTKIVARVMDLNWWQWQYIRIGYWLRQRKPVWSWEVPTSVPVRSTQQLEFFANVCHCSIIPVQYSLVI